MTRNAFIYAFDATEPNPVERACFSPGRARRRNDLHGILVGAPTVEAEFNDVAEVARSGGILRPDRRSPMRAGKWRRMWIFDPLYVGC